MKRPIPKLLYPREVGYARLSNPAIVRLTAGTYLITATPFSSPALSTDVSSMLFVSDARGWSDYSNTLTNGFARTLNGAGIGAVPREFCVDVTGDYYFFARTDDSIVEFCVEAMEDSE